MSFLVYNNLKSIYLHIFVFPSMYVYTQTLIRITGVYRSEDACQSVQNCENLHAPVYLLDKSNASRRYQKIFRNFQYIKFAKTFKCI